MEKLKSMKEALMNCAQSQIHGNLSNVDAKELGEVIDMIKDLEETIYYCTVIEAMEEAEENKEKNGHQQMYYPPMYYPYYMSRDMDRDIGKMYYNPYDYDHEWMNNSVTRMGGGRYGYNSSSSNGGRSGGSSGNGSNGGQGGYSSGSNSGGSNGGRSFTEGYERYPMEIRDAREGKSSMTRRSYMEGKEIHKDKALQMQELEKYMHELSEDITEMIMDASPEEKTLLQEKLKTLATKVK